MSTPTASTTGAKDSAVKASRTIAPIDGTNGRFEWYRYNEDLRIIHSVEDDTFHAGSIARALGSTKRVNDWLSNKQTKELLSGFEYLREFPQVLLTTQKTKFNDIKIIEGTYIHRLLVNHFAMWVSPKYAYKISVLLDDHFELRRKVEENRALEDKNKSLMQKVDEQTVRIEELMKRLDYTIDQNDDLLDRMDTVQTHVEAMSPIVTSLKNRISTISDEHLLVYATDDTGDTTRIKIHAVNTSTMNARGYKPEDAIAYIEGGNTVNVQNELYRLILDRGMNIGRINRKEKCFTIRRIDLNSLKQLIELELNSRINSETESLNKTAKTIESTAPKCVKKVKEYMGYPVNYCRSVCDKWSISKEILTEIINGEWCYNAETKTIILHKSKGLLYRTRVKGQTIYKPVPATYWIDSN